MTDSDSDPQEPVRDEEISCQLARYLRLTSFPELDLMFAGDLGFKGRLEAVRDSLRDGNGVSSGARRVLIDRIDDLIVEWY